MVTGSVTIDVFVIFRAEGTELLLRTLPRGRWRLVARS